MSEEKKESFKEKWEKIHYNDKYVSIPMELFDDYDDAVRDAKQEERRRIIHLFRLDDNDWDKKIYSVKEIEEFLEREKE